MALEGSLKDFGLSDILQLIYHQKKTGTLIMRNSLSEASVIFDKGLIVTADISNTQGLDKIGEVLLRSGKITEDQLKQALITQRSTNDKIGVILVAMGAVLTEDLIKALGFQTREAVLSLFKWKEGRYSFEPSDISYQREYWLPINTEYLIMEGVRRIDEWPYIVKTIPSLDLVFEKNPQNSNKITVVTGADGTTESLNEESSQEVGIQITRDETNLYNLIDGQQDVRTLIEVANLGEFETCKALSNLLTSGLILQKTVSELSIAQEVDRKPVDVAISRNRGRQLINGSIILACFLFWGLNLDRLAGTLAQSNKIAESYTGMTKTNLLNRMSFSVETYYYQKEHLPESLESLVQDGYTSADSVKLLSGIGVKYEPDNERGTFILR
jgi:Domain of unknown function (DUF4388)